LNRLLNSKKGLREGDRPVSINDIKLDDKTYPDIIELIENRYGFCYFHNFKWFNCFIL